MTYTVLFPTDGSDAAKNAAKRAIDLADRYDAELHVLAVVDASIAFGATDTWNVSDVRDKAEKAAEEATAEIASLAEEAGIEATTAVVQGEPAERILEYVDREGIDAIAMSTHGRSGVRRSLLGSVTDKVIRRSSVPVFVVPADVESA